MSHARFLSAALPFLILVASCGASKSERKPDAPEAAATQPSPPAAQGATSDSVWVQKPDASKQCKPKSGIALEAAAKELVGKGVTILEKKKGNDGMMHAQVCGGATGKTNAFRVPKADQAKAEAAGFKLEAAPN